MSPVLREDTESVLFVATTVIKLAWYSVDIVSETEMSKKKLLGVTL